MGGSLGDGFLIRSLNDVHGSTIFIGRDSLSRFWLLLTRPCGSATQKPSSLCNAWVLSTSESHSAIVASALHIGTRIRCHLPCPHNSPPSVWKLVRGSDMCVYSSQLAWKLPLHLIVSLLCQPVEARRMVVSLLIASPILWEFNLMGVPLAMLAVHLHLPKSKISLMVIANSYISYKNKHNIARAAVSRLSDEIPWSLDGSPLMKPRVRNSHIIRRVHRIKNGLEDNYHKNYIRK